MSIILDALRKSEAARRRAEAPDLFTTLPPPPAPDARAHGTRRAWRAGTAAGVIAVLAIGWWWLQRTPEVAPDAVADTADAPVTASPGVLPPPVATESTVDGPGVAPPMVAPAPAAMPSPPAQAPVAGAVVDAPPKSRPLPATAVETPPAGPAAPPMPAAPPATPPPSSGNEPIAVGRLDAGTRGQLPPLRVSMHLYDADPARRFIILDDKRLGEGDLSGEIVVERIDRDGAVLSWRGTRLRIAPP